MTERLQRVAHQHLEGDNSNSSPKKLLQLNSLDKIKSQSIDKQIKQMEQLIKTKEEQILDTKRSEVKRLVRDYMNPNSQLRKLEIDYKKFFLCLFGDSYWELEFFK